MRCRSRQFSGLHMRILSDGRYIAPARRLPSCIRAAGEVTMVDWVMVGVTWLVGVACGGKFEQWVCRKRSAQGEERCPVCGTALKYGGGH